MSDELKQTRARLDSGALTKHAYIDAMHVLHERLFEYAQFMKGTEVGKIEIVDGDVIFYSRAGIGFICDPQDLRLAPIEALNFGRYEDSDGDMLYRLLRPEFTVFDIGANIGWYSMHIARKFPATKIFAFEPIPATYSYLSRNLALNALPNVRAFNFGLSNQTGPVTFFFPPRGSGGASAADLSGAADVRRVECQLRTLDAAADELGASPDFMKIDVEGAELFVFQGGMKCIARSKPIIFCEMLRKWSAKFNYHPNEIIALLATAGYACHEAANGRLKPVREVTDATVATNFFFFHQEKHRAAVGAINA